MADVASGVKQIRRALRPADLAVLSMFFGYVSATFSTLALGGVRVGGELIHEVKERG
jgi:hypothetical protein